MHAAKKVFKQNNHVIEIIEKQKAAGETRHISKVGPLSLNDKLLADQTDRAKVFVKFIIPINIYLKLARFKLL